MSPPSSVANRSMSRNPGGRVGHRIGRLRSGWPGCFTGKPPSVWPPARSVRNARGKRCVDWATTTTPSPHNGQPLEAAEVQGRLEQRVAAVEEVVAEAQLGERGREAVGKSRRWLVLLAATLTWYWVEVRRRIEALELSSSAERAVYQQLLPGLYWEAAAERGRDAEQRQRLRQLSQRLLRRARSPRGPLGRLAERGAGGGGEGGA